MSDVRKMIEAIALDDYAGAREALKTTLADYMTGRTYVSNSDLYGKDYIDDYKNPNVEDDLRIQAALSGGELRDHDKTGKREDREEGADYEDDVIARKKIVKKQLRKGGIHTGEDLEESIKVLYAVYGDKVDGPVGGKTFKTEAEAEKFQDSLWNSPDWHQYASRPRELFVDTYEE